LESPYSITSNAVAVDILELEIYWLELCLCQLGLGYFRIKYRVENGFYILDNGNDIRTNDANKAMEIFHERDFHHILENNSCGYNA